MVEFEMSTTIQEVFIGELPKEILSIAAPLTADPRPSNKMSIGPDSQNTVRGLFKTL